MYWAALIGNETLADKGKLDGALAMWLPDIVIGAIGLLLVSQMGRHRQFFRYAWLRGLLGKVGIGRKEPAA